MPAKRKLRVPLSSMLITLALAEAFGTFARFERSMRREGHVTIVECRGFVSAAQLHEAWSESFPIPARIVHRDSGRGPGRLERFIDEIDQAVLTSMPVIVILRDARELPAIYRKIADDTLTVSGISSEGVIWLLKYTHSQTGRIAHWRVREALPDDRTMRRMTMTEIGAALREETAIKAAVRLAELATLNAVDGPTLADFTEFGEAYRVGKAIVDDIQAWGAGKLRWNDLTRSAIFYGPPGTGKTYIARAIAATAKVAVVETNFAKWQAAGHLGDLLAAMAKSFAEARATAPCVMVIDEIDSAGSRETAGSSLEYRRQVINGFLQEVDGFAGLEGVVLIGCCNDVTALDPAIKRPGRFDRLVRIDLPNKAAITAILRQHLDDALPDDCIDGLARMALGRSAAAVSGAIRAARTTARAKGHQLTPDDIAREFGGDRPVSWRAAVHEAGHVAAASALMKARVLHVALLPDGGGYTRLSAPTNLELTADEIAATIAMRLAGREAEIMLCGGPSAGAGGFPESDLAHATRLAIDFEASYGLGASLAWRGREVAFSSLSVHQQEIVEKHLATAANFARAVIEANRDAVIGLARDLHNRRTLENDDLDAWMQLMRRPAMTVAGNTSKAIA
ncbi:peptidase M41-like protein [Zavarzinia compransoris]|nr:peptidase M41-like protein [Zavarzinia compransoris]